MIWKNLWRRKTRTLLTMTGIAVGIGVVVALLVMAEALAGQFSAIMEKSTAEVKVIFERLCRCGRGGMERILPGLRSVPRSI